MKCPVCAATDSRVLDSRPSPEGNSIKRRRECLGCGRRFNTYEVIETTPLVVLKKDGSREFYDSHKLRTGLLRACYKRPVDVDIIVSDIEAELNAGLLTEVSTRQIGEMAMERLRRADEVSYVRFASVYREFADADSFVAELQKILKPDR
ncbi:MAG: transcriptional regulator NrdR [Eubacteriales bacterium]